MQCFGGAGGCWHTPGEPHGVLLRPAVYSSRLLHCAAVRTAVQAQHVNSHCVQANKARTSRAATRLKHLPRLGLGSRLRAGAGTGLCVPTHWQAMQHTLALAAQPDTAVVVCSRNSSAVPCRVMQHGRQRSGRPDASPPL